MYKSELSISMILKEVWFWTNRDILEMRSYEALKNIFLNFQKFGSFFLAHPKKLSGWIYF